MAPTNMCPVLVSSNKLQVEVPPKRVLTVMRWGLMPGGMQENYKTSGCIQKTADKRTALRSATLQPSQRAAVVSWWLPVAESQTAVPCAKMLALMCNPQANTYSETLTVRTYRFMCCLLTRLQSYEVTSVHVLWQQCFVQWPHWLEAAST